MRDALTAFDQVVAFAGTTVGVEDVSSVLGLVGRDLLLDILTAVADEQATAAFELAGRAIDAGYDLRLLCRELSRLVRDLMLVAVDKSRLKDAEVVPDGERARIEALVARFSREDLLRAFDLVARTEAELRNAAEPRYHLEMALLKWIHLRKLAPLAELIEQLQQQGALPAAGAPAGPGGTRPGQGFGAGRGTSVAQGVSPAKVQSGSAGQGAGPARMPGGKPAAQGFNAAKPAGPPAAEARRPPAAQAKPPQDDPPQTTFVAEEEEFEERPQALGSGGFKETFLAQVRQSKLAFYQMTVAQAYRIEVQGDRVVFEFTPVHRLMRDQLEQNRSWLEPLAARIAGRRMQVVSAIVDAPAKPERGGSGGGVVGPAPDLKAQATADPAMQAVLDLIPVEITDVERIRNS